LSITLSHRACAAIYVLILLTLSACATAAIPLTKARHIGGPASITYPHNSSCRTSVNKFP
jgi:hypothetical protein